MSTSAGSPLRGREEGVFVKMRTLLEDPYSRARQEKEKGRKIIGITPMHFPEELVHASGALPVILQETNEPITLGWSYSFPNLCAFARSNVDAAAKGKMDFLDGIVISDICMALRIGFSIVRQRTSLPMIYTWWPSEYKFQRWYPIVSRRLERCRKALEEIVGKRIDDQSIQASIGLYNTNRQLLRQVYEIRSKKPGVLSCREMQELVVSSMVMPKEEHNRLLQELIPKLQNRKHSSDGKTRLFLSAHLCHRVKPDLLNLIEDMDAVVVGDDLYTGYRYYASEVPSNVPPMEAMMRRYFDSGLPCPTKCGPEADWADYIIKASSECGAQGVIFLMPKFCEPHMFYYPYLKDRLTDAGIPHTFVETEHSLLSLEGIKTRIEAFMEMLKA